MNLVFFSVILSNFISGHSHVPHPALSDHIMWDAEQIVLQR